MTAGAIAQNWVLFGVPVLIWMLVVQWRAKAGLPELLTRLGLQPGNIRDYLIASAVTLPFLPVVIWLTQWTSSFEGAMLKPFVGLEPTAAVVLSVFGYGFLATGIPEELLFRGLIGGALFRRLSFWTANVLQAACFLVPHLLLLFFAPSLWPIAVTLPLAMGLVAGWLRHRSGSIGPAIILHAVPNTVGALAVLQW